MASLRDPSGFVRDNGRTWRASDELPFANIQRVEFDPANDVVIYVTTFGGSVWHGPARHPNHERVRPSISSGLPRRFPCKKAQHAPFLGLERSRRSHVWSFSRIAGSASQEVDLDRPAGVMFSRNVFMTHP